MTCSVSATDSQESTTDSASVEIENSIPTVSNVYVLPTQPYTNDTVTAYATASDADSGQSLQLHYTWYVNGNAVVNGYGMDTLSGVSSFSKGDNIFVSVYATDGVDQGPSDSSSIVTVENSPPSSPTVGLSPTDPTEGIEDLTCSASGSSDADNDSVQYTYSWVDPWQCCQFNHRLQAPVIPWRLLRPPLEIGLVRVTATDGSATSSVGSLL